MAALFETEPEPTAEPPAPKKSGREPPPPARPGIADPMQHGATLLERRSAACSLVAVVAEYAEGLAGIDEVFRTTRGCLYCLSKDELVRFAKGLVALFKSDPPMT